MPPVLAAGCDDLRSAVGSVIWLRLTATWAARHVYTHNDGVIDEKYLQKVPSSSAQVGQRLVITETDSRRAIEDATTLCKALATLTA
ncbi:hypothetical protein [Streptomyces coeruleorubidus]|uniref:hypothetical protein n=1 Tax=Streptomyces coeruleorubidus TaxID=116188 RepID=UPI0033C949C4